MELIPKTLSKRFVPRFFDSPTTSPSAGRPVLPILHNLQEQSSLAYFFIGHELRGIRHICDEVTVTYRGKPVESSPVADIFERPQNDYMRMLLDAMPDPDPGRPPFRQAASA
jgi:ABC-type oligopeptide transport system ATPase subunit